MTLTVSIDVDDYQAKAIALDRKENLFGKISDSDYLSVRLIEFVNSITQKHIQQPQLSVVLESLKADPDTLKSEAKKRGFDIDASLVDNKD